MVRRPLVFINAKWLSHPVTGTERYAMEITRSWAAARPRNAVLLVPADAVIPEWARAFRIVRSRLRGVLFEQLYVPLRSLGRWSISMGGPAPVLKRRQVVVLHDASVFVIPQSYSRRFVLWYRTLYRVLARTARRLVTVSEFSAGELSRYLHVPHERFRVVPGGCEHIRDRTESRPDVGELPADFALFLGTPAPHKNVRPALAAFARAKVPCVVVGWAGRSDIFDFAGQQAPPDQVRVLGRLSDAEVVWLLRRATALVFPSLYEGFGLPLLEAQSQGCAVIASNAAALPEVAGDGALYFDPADPEAAVAQFLRLRDGDTRARLIEHARANLTRFSWERSALAIADMAGIRLGGVTSPR